MSKEENNLMSKLSQDDFFYLGRWIDNVLDTEFWMKWAETNSIKKLTKIKCDSDRASIDGYFFHSRKTHESVSLESYNAAKNKNWDYFDNFYKVSGDIIHDMENLKNYLMTKSRFDLADVEKFFKEFRELYSPWLLVFPISEGLERMLSEQAETEGVDLSSISDNFAPSSDPEMAKQIKDMRCLVEKMKEKGILYILDNDDFERIKENISNSDQDLYLEIKKHIEKYAWIGVHHFWGWGEALTEGKLYAEMKKESKKIPFSEHEVKKVKLSNDLEELINVVNHLAYYRFRLAETSGYIVYSIREQLKELCADIGVSYEEICWFKQEEIMNALRENKKLNKDKIQSREESFGWIYIAGDDYLFTNEEEISLALKILGIAEVGGVSEIKGSVACRGFVRGVVRIVNKPENAKDFKEGEILVSPETTPDFIGAMKKAIAFITDIGGLTWLEK